MFEFNREKKGYNKSFCHLRLAAEKKQQWKVEKRNKGGTLMMKLAWAVCLCSANRKRWFWGFTKEKSSSNNRYNYLNNQQDRKENEQWTKHFRGKFNWLLLLKGAWEPGGHHKSFGRGTSQNGPLFGGRDHPACYGLSDGRSRLIFLSAASLRGCGSLTAALIETNKSTLCSRFIQVSHLHSAGGHCQQLTSA